jgi:DNA-binding LacI/PurR family transcriptional regulator
VARLRGYREGLLAHNLPDELLISGSPPTDGAVFADSELISLGRAAARRLVERGSLVTGVIAVNDIMAIGLIAGLRELKVSVPDDFSVVGIDDISLSSLIAPALTTVRQPFEAMAAAAIERLVIRLSGDVGTLPGIVFAPELMLRDSTASPSRRARQ